MAGSPKHVVVVGAGIAGLACAHALSTRAETAGVPLTCTVMESMDRCGGKILTHQVDGLVIEAGPDSFLSQNPWALSVP